MNEVKPELIGSNPATIPVPRPRTTWRDVDEVPKVDARQIETVLKLAEVSWREFDQRRTYEWKVNLALWGGLGSLAGFAAKAGLPLTVPRLLFADLVLLSIGVMYTFRWSVGLRQSNQHDQLSAAHFWSIAERSVNGNTLGPFHERREHLLLRAAAKDANRSYVLKIGGVLADWSHGSQIFVTWLLVGLAMASLGQWPLMSWLGTQF